MTTSEITGAYARALFDLANAADAVDAADAGLRVIAETVRGNVELRDALADSAIPADKKRAIVRDLFAEAGSPEAVAIASTMVERGLVASLGDVLTAFGKIAEAERGILVAEVTTAVSMADDTRASLVQKLSAALGHPVSLREKVDASIVGGIRINVGGRVLDGTLSSQLDAMRSTLAISSQGGEV
ncbi:MAG: ATP synthase F1 subunit delta [Coriobacteriia bacterium]|nr:ATP synthase F1 subunit delta [Coriobacteriia bacterium]MDO9108205.1 ATP synthase F1 subunit delta [Coriobacteriia bacterium]